jgi:hypothetical protein
MFIAISTARALFATLRRCAQVRIAERVAPSSTACHVSVAAAAISQLLLQSEELNPLKPAAPLEVGQPFGHSVPVGVFGPDVSVVSGGVITVVGTVTVSFFTVVVSWALAITGSIKQPADTTRILSFIVSSWR